MNLKLCVLCVAFFGVTAPLAAQSVLFSDTLTGSPTNWTNTPANVGGGTTVFSATGLGYAVGSPTTDDTGYRYLSAYQAFPTSSWTAQVDVHFANLVTSHQFANLNLIVAYASDPDPMKNMAILALDQYNPTGLVRDISSSVIIGGTETYYPEILNPTTDATLRLAFSAVTGQMVYSYDSDGVAVNGENFTIANIVDVSGWNLAPTTPFLFYLVGGSGGATIGPVITTPDAYFTNFIVYSGAAVPEPAVTAVLAGIITLGFAVWLRRRRV